MTKATKDSIIARQFDFATLSGCVSDIRKGFWNIERTNEFYRNKLKTTHSHFYQQIIPGRTEKRMEDEARLKKGGFIKTLRLVDDPLQNLKKQKKKEEIKFDSGSERESHRSFTDIEPSDSDSNASRVSVDNRYKPLFI